jgi:hypothetical protein
VFLGESAFNLFYYFAHADFNTALYRNDGYLQLVDYLVAADHDREQLYYLSPNDIFPIYYLWVKQDFSRRYAEEFTHGLEIEQIDNLRFTGAHCPSDLILPAGVQVINSYDCDYDQARYELVKRIQGSSELLGFRVLQVRASGATDSAETVVD